MKSERLIVWYYLATAVFLLLDLVFGWNVRVAFLDDHTAARLGYYGVCFFCLGLMLWKPRWTVFVAAFESLVVLVSLIVSTALKVLIVSDDMLEHGRGFVSTGELINFLVSGFFAYYTWYFRIRAVKDAISQK